MNLHTIFVIYPKKPGEQGPFINQVIEGRMNMLISYIRGVNSTASSPMLYYRCTGGYDNMQVMLGIKSYPNEEAARISDIFLALCKMGFFFGSLTTTIDSVAEEMLDDDSVKIALHPNTFPIHLIHDIESDGKNWKMAPSYFGEWE